MRVTQQEKAIIRGWWPGYRLAFKSNGEVVAKHDSTGNWTTISTPSETASTVDAIRNMQDWILHGASDAPNHPQRIHSSL